MRLREYVGSGDQGPWMCVWPPMGWNRQRRRSISVGAAPALVAAGTYSENNVAVPTALLPTLTPFHSGAKGGLVHSRSGFAIKNSCRISWAMLPMQDSSAENSHQMPAVARRTCLSPFRAPPSARGIQEK